MAYNLILPCDVNSAEQCITDRLDYKIICDIIQPGSKVLDLGCGDGDLLALLIEKKNIIGRGVEISDESVHNCIIRGLSVNHADIDEGLSDYPDKLFDYVILSQTLQVTHRPEMVFREMLRIGRYGIVSFPNFGYWRVRLQLLLSGRMPKTSSLPYEWYNTPNIHLLTITDFFEFCKKFNLKIENALYFGRKGLVKTMPNLRALGALFVVSEG